MTVEGCCPKTGGMLMACVFICIRALPALKWFAAADDIELYFAKSFDLKSTKSYIKTQ